MATYHRPRTRLQTESEQLRLCHLPEACLALILRHAAEGVPWKERCRLAEVCRAFRALFASQAFAGRAMCLDLNSLSWRLAERKKKAAARAELLAAVARYASSVTHLRLKYMLDRCAGLSLPALLAPLAPRVRVLEAEDGLCTALVEALSMGAGARGGGGGSRGGGGGSVGGGWAWASLQEVSFTGCNLWIDLEPAELGAMERQLAALPQLTSRVAKFECSCQGMPEGGEAFFRHLTGLRCLELEDWLSWEVARDYGPLRAMPHLTRLGLNIVEDLGPNLEPLLRLTQVRELSLQGLYHACSGITQLTNLKMLDLQQFEPLDAAAAAAGEQASWAAWKVGSLTELRWCGDLAFEEGSQAPIQLPHLVALEIDEAYFPPSGFHAELCSALTQLTSLRLVGGRCPRLPPAISQLARLQVLAIDSCQLPTIPASISALTAVTNLQLSNTSLSPHLPAWVLSLPIQKLWVASNQLSSLLPAKAGRTSAAAFEERKVAWLARLTHVCLYSNSFREVPPPLLEHAAGLQELDLSYNHHLQVRGAGPVLLACAYSLSNRNWKFLRLLRLEKSYWLRLEDRWTRASLRAIARLQREQPDLQIDYQHHQHGVRLAW
ncbi:hypothetical protein ABPG75_006049 [Micractinium tetrahymenae]